MNRSEPQNSRVLSNLDRHFARFMERMAGGQNTDLKAAAALVSWSRGQGNICFDLRTMAGKTFTELDDAATDAYLLPELDVWSTKLHSTPTVGRPGEFKPLILDDSGRLYLQRYWEYEASLAEALQQRARVADLQVDENKLRDGLTRFFPVGEHRLVKNDKQQLAAITAVRRRLCVISGGPGTGKTRTVVMLLALLLEQAEENALRIALAAPTGKAAGRLQESIRTVKGSLPCTDSVRTGLPDSAVTVHRLIGATPDSARTKYNADNPLPFDVVVVDEASMVDLALMAKLFVALPAEARVILLGDRDQLASVEPGAVLGDICHRDPTQPEAPLARCIVELEINYRFGASSGIPMLSQSIKNGETTRALELLGNPTQNFEGIGGMTMPAPNHLKASLASTVLEGFKPLIESTSPREALEILNLFRILCAVRHGPYGVNAINRLVEEILAESGVLATQDDWYSGRPILVTRNDYSLRLFNGDVGVILPDPQSGEPRAWFPGTDKEEPRSVLPLRLPEHETVFAMTVHKSQGSEFDRVLVLLPDRDSPVLSRELVYTAVTRASQRAELWFTEAALQTAIEKKADRSSGLREKLRPDANLGRHKT